MMLSVKGVECNMDLLVLSATTVDGSVVLVLSCSLKLLEMMKLENAPKSA